MSRRKSIIINPQDRIELKSIATDVFAEKIEQHPLVELMKYWLRIFQNEILPDFKILKVILDSAHDAMPYYQYFQLILCSNPFLSS